MRMLFKVFEGGGLIGLCHSLTVWCKVGNSKVAYKTGRKQKLAIAIWLTGAEQLLGVGAELLLNKV